MKTAAAFLGIFALVFAARLCHKDIVWVEEAYPITAALEMMRGKVLYRDLWFDKPPLFPEFYTWFSAAIGWKLRLAGALLVTGSSISAFWLARRLWTRVEGLWAAGLLAFFLTFGMPAAVMAVAPDLLMVLPQLFAILFCAQKRPVRAGAAAGVALLINPKAVYVLAACLAWQWRAAHWVALGFLAVQGPALAWMAREGSLRPYWDQVWVWGFLYSRDSPFDNPWKEGLTRSANWCGFHAALLVAAWQARKKLSIPRVPVLIWLALSVAAVFAGWRFFPRYYFHLLVPMVILAARGFVVMGRRTRYAVLALLLIPLIRFGPRYVQQATGRPWGDLALHDDAHAAADIVRQRGARSLLVWGYRPEVFAYSRVPAATPYLDSQPLTGVIADRHLTSSTPTAPELAQRNRALLVAYDPDVIVDGLGPLNPALAITQYPELARWLERYQEVARTRYCVIYGLKSQSLP